jgi:hypothetical protein
MFTNKAARLRSRMRSSTVPGKAAARQHNAEYHALRRIFAAANAVATLTLVPGQDLRAQQAGAPEAEPLRSGFHFSIGLGS